MSKSKFGRPKKRNIDGKKLNQFLKSIGFEIQQIFQPWRHVIAIGKYQNKDAIFKLASTKTTSTHTKNEYYWNEVVHSTHLKYRQNFTVPQNLSFGNYGNLFYLIEEKFMGEPFVENNVLNISMLSSKIKRIAIAIREIETLPISKTSNFYKDQSKKERKPIGESLYNSAKFWASRSSLNLDELLLVLEKNKNNVRTCVGHGDFSPRQLYYENEKIGIIDGEHAGIKGPIYYDTAYFYIRLRSEYDQKDLANHFLIEFKNLLKIEEKETFWEDLKPVLIQRYIGSVWDRGNNLDLEKESIFQKEILEDRLLID